VGTHHPVRPRILCSRRSRKIRRNFLIPELCFLYSITFLQILPRFELIDTSDDRWAKIEAKIQQLDQDSPKKVMKETSGISYEVRIFHPNFHFRLLLILWCAPTMLVRPRILCSRRSRNSATCIRGKFWSSQTMFYDP
jgi:hypothetical protein